MAEATLSLLQELFPTLDSALLTDIVAGAGAECSVESLVEELLSMQQQQHHQRVQEETPLPATGLCSATRPSVDGKPATILHSGGGGSSCAPVRSAHTTNEGEESGALVLVPPISSDDHLPMPCSSSSLGASPWGGPPRQERAAAASLEDQLASIRQHRKERWRKESSSSSSSNNKRQPAREDTVGQAQSTSGFDIGLWRQMKDFRTKQRAKWSRSSERKKAMTLSDLAPEPNSDTATAAASAAGGASRMPHIEKIGHECLTLTNNFRQRSGLRPLRWETVLYKIGLQHSHSMGTGQVEFGHAGFKERMQAVPYRPRHMAENVAYSQGVADVAGTAVHGWIRSPGHRKNILCPAANRCAIAVYCNSRGRYYLTQLFSD